MPKTARPIHTCLLALLVVVCLPSTAAATDAWRWMSEPGHAILIRHANAPGTGDPAAFELGDCATQRNLDATGRSQARRLGQRLRAHGVSERRVYTSQWCRCRETARLLDVGGVAPLEALNSFFGERYSEDQIMPRLRAFLRERELDPPPVLVTHSVNITALTGTHASEGEIIVVEVTDDGTIKTKGRIAPDGD